ncbi:MAG TPA: stressosome-associated protein Prli42 [Bacillota bacterium]|nr:stressosome-associated protein Prli42 [Bacillota bacterium]
MSKSQQNSYKRKPSKRQRKVKIVIYIMIIAMILSMATAGLATFI